MKGLKTVVTALVLRRLNATRAPQKEVAGIIVEIDGTMTRVMMPAFSVSLLTRWKSRGEQFYYGEMR